MVGPVSEFPLAEVQDLPSLVFEYFLRQPQHFRRLLVLLRDELVQVVVYGDLEVVEHIVQGKQIVLSHEGDGVEVAAVVEEALEFEVLSVGVVVVLELDGVEVLLRVPELMLEVLHFLAFD